MSENKDNYDELNKLYDSYFNKYKEYIIHTDPNYIKIFKYEIEKTYKEINKLINKLGIANKNDIGTSSSENSDIFKSFVESNTSDNNDSTGNGFSSTGNGFSSARTVQELGRI